MKNIKLWQVAVIVLVVFTTLFSISAIINRDGIVQESQNNVTESQSLTISIEGIFTDRNIQFVPPKTVLELLHELNDQTDEILLVVKDYSGLGTLVESMGGKTNGLDNQYWQYTVNGVMPQVGADKLEINNGDVIKWNFNQSEF